MFIYNQVNYGNLGDIYFTLILELKLYVFYHL